MTVEKKLTRTSVMVQSEAFDDFKILCVKNKFSLQKLTDRAIYLYINDLEWRKFITNTKIPD